MTNEGASGARVGNWSECVEHRVEANEIAFCAEATDDPIPQHRSGEVAPLIYAAVVTGHLTGEALARITPEFETPDLHCWYSIKINRPLVPHMRVVSRVRSSGGRLYPGGSSAVLLETTTTGGRLVNRQLIGAKLGEDGDVPRNDAHIVPPQREAGSALRVPQQLDEEQTAGFSAVVDDLIVRRNRDPINSEVSGFLQRMLAVTATTSAAVINEVGDGDPCRLRSFSVRVRTDIDWRSCITRIWRTNVDQSLAHCSFDSLTSSGRVVADIGSATLFR